MSKVLVLSSSRNPEVGYDLVLNYEQHTIGLSQFVIRAEGDELIAEFEFDEDHELSEENIRDVIRQWVKQISPQYTIQ